MTYETRAMLYQRLSALTLELNTTKAANRELETEVQRLRDELKEARK